MKKIEDIVELERLANRIRQDLLETTVETGFEQPASYLSATEIITALFFNHLRHDPARPGWAERDRLILSRGHAAPVLYCAYVEAGYLPRDLLPTLCKPGSQLPHPVDSRLLPLLEASATSLGNGLSFGLGAALSGRLEQVDYRVYVLLGNDDIQRDQFWEPAMWTSFHKADHLCVIVDYNYPQLDKRVKKLMELEPMEPKWNSLNWQTLMVDGHDMRQLLGALSQARDTKGKPTCLIAHTGAKPPQEVNSKAHPEGASPSSFCPNCGTPLMEQKCKLVCSRCDYYMSCSDYV